MNTVRSALCLGAVALAVLATAIPGSAQARGGSVSVGVGVNLGPVYPAYPAYGYYHRPRYYAPPVVMYAPPPPVVVYEQPPPVMYAPPPVVQASPAGPIYRAGAGQQCREYQSTTVIGGRPQATYGTACLEADGTWRIVN